MDTNAKRYLKKFLSSMADVVWVAPTLIMLWGLGLAISSRRYQ